jgi:hypothetical protein
VTYLASDRTGWGLLRSTRADPPPAAKRSADRRRTYVFALEQAEQLFTAATATGPASQPLLLFYGLSQAGRAIAAADTGITDNSWNLSGHGIRAKGMDRPLHEVQAIADANGSFVRLAELLGTPIDRGTELTLGELWNTLPDVRAWPIATPPHGRTPLLVTPRWNGDTHPLASALVSGIPREVVAAGDADSLHRFMAGYPAAEGFSYVRLGYGPDAAPAFSTVDPDGSGEINMNWEVPAGEDQDFLTRRATGYCGAQYFLPGIGTDRVVLHPLMNWWAMLFLLSMLARYTPAQWQKHIAVDSSTVAVPLEQALNSALETVPALVMQAIREVSTDGHHR